MQNNRVILEKITAFLKDHDFLVQNEILPKYPYPFAQYDAWIQELSYLSKEEIVAFENGDLSKVSESLKTFVKSCRDLSEFAQMKQEETKLPKMLLLKLNQKKVHEVKRLVHEIDKLKPKTVIDIGGGVGYLGQGLAHHFGVEVFSIDMDKYFQDQGRIKIEKYLPEIKNNFHFINSEFSPNQLKTIEKKHPSLLIGLHSCGELSILEMKTFFKSDMDQFINVPCCYHKMGPYEPMSEVGQKLNLNFTPDALHFASHGQRPMDITLENERWAVKEKRYLLHMLMKDVMNEGFVVLKSAHPLDYQLNFVDYCKKMLLKVKLTPPSDEVIQRFYENPKNKLECKKMYLLGSVRCHLARLTEITILLDRALWMTEIGMKVEMTQIFESAISPRNIGFIVTKN